MSGPVLAAIDVGSHSTKLSVARRRADGEWDMLHERVTVTGLGLGNPARDGLDPDGRQRTLDDLATCGRIVREAGAVAIDMVGTAVLREANDTDRFVTDVARATGLELSVIDGAEEARLTYLGAVSTPSEPADNRASLVADIGGRSTEIAWGRDSTPDGRRSIPVGTISLTAEYGLDRTSDGAALDAARTTVERLFDNLPAVPQPNRLICVGATPASLLALHHGRMIADRHEVHGKTLDREIIATQTERLARRDADSRAALPGLHPGRAPVMLAGALIVGVLAARWQPAPLVISTYGLRAGLLENRMRENLARNPGLL